MKHARSFHPARPLAQHCAELTERGVRPEDRAEHLAAWRRDVAREVAQDMADLLSGTRIEARLSEPEIMRGDAVFARIGAVAANSLLRCGADDQIALLSFETETAIALTDRSFGGSGEPVGEPVAALPRSAALLVEQASRIIARAIARVSACSDVSAGATGASSGETGSESRGDVIIRSESASRLKPFSPLTPCALMLLDLIAADGMGWSARLALPADRLDSLLPGLAAGRPVVDSPGEETGEDPGETGSARAVLGHIPLPLRAVLAEFELSLGQLERLAPGDRIPLAIARDIPLRMGSRLVACGSLGTIEDRMALKLTSVSGEGLPA